MFVTTLLGLWSNELTYILRVPFDCVWVFAATLVGFWPNYPTECIRVLVDCLWVFTPAVVGLVPKVPTEIMCLCRCNVSVCYHCDSFAIKGANLVPSCPCWWLACVCCHFGWILTELCMWLYSCLSRCIVSIFSNVVWIWMKCANVVLTCHCRSNVSLCCHCDFIVINLAN